MMRTGILTALVLLACIMLTPAANAGGDGCACCAKGAADAPQAMAKSKDMAGEPFAITPCPMCGEAGGLCEHCKAYASEYLSNLADMICPNCAAPDFCEQCKMAIEGGLAALPKLEVVKVAAPEHTVAYEAGMFFDDRGALISKTVEDAGAQNLLGENTMVASIYPDVMSNMITETTPVYACVSLPEGATPAAPLMSYTVPAGSYMMVNHYGPYEMIGMSWMAAFCFADMNGIEFGTGPAGEHYVSDPMSTPQAELLTQIFIPLAVGTTEAADDTAAAAHS